MFNGKNPRGSKYSNENEASRKFMVMSITWTDLSINYVQNQVGLQQTKMKIITVGLQKWTNFQIFCGTFFLVPEDQKSLTIPPSYERTDGRTDGQTDGRTTDNGRSE